MSSLEKTHIRQKTSTWTYRSVAEESLAIAAAALSTPASPFSDSGAETEVNGVLAPVLATDPLPEAEALAACRFIPSIPSCFYELMEGRSYLFSQSLAFDQDMNESTW